MAAIISTQLNNGRQISAGCCIVSTSERGTMLFTPSDRANRNFIRVAEVEAKTFFGDYPVIVIQPQTRTDNAGRPWLPPVRMIAEFTSEPIDDEYHYSTAVVIWYQEASTPFIGEDVHRDFGQIEWEKHARDCRLCF